MISRRILPPVSFPLSFPAASSFSKKEQVLHDPGLCIDDDITCKDWAAAGECVKNKGFMVGAGDYP